jgi:exodeoxyribonuclease VIII
MKSLCGGKDGREAMMCLRSAPPEKLSSGCKGAMDELAKFIWQSKLIWANGPTYDMNIIEHAYKSYGKPLPWQFYVVRDARTIYSLWPDLPRPPTSHHALEDCRRQINMLQATLKHLNIRELK